MQRRCTCLLFLLLLAAGCRPGRGGLENQEGADSSATLTVFAAASLTDVFIEIGKAFEAARPGTRVTFNFAGSQQLAQQLGLGAPGDVFASASPSHMQAVVRAGRVAPEAPQVFARNRLVLICPPGNPAHLRTLRDLARPGLRLLVAAPEVPAGRYALEVLEKAAQAPAFGASFPELVLRNVVSYEQDVRSVRAKVALGEADAGIVYTSDLAGTGAAGAGRVEIPDALNVVAAYPMAPLRDSAQPALAAAFIDFVRSEQGQALLARYGFLPPDTPET